MLKLSASVNEQRDGKPIVLLDINSDSPVEVRSRCFVDDPPPPGFKECSECSFNQVETGLSTIRPDLDFWAEHSGKLIIEARNESGEKDTAEIPM